MTFYLATTDRDARRMLAMGRLRTLTSIDGRPCGCRLPARLWRTPELARAHPNEAGRVDVLLTVTLPGESDGRDLLNLERAREILSHRDVSPGVIEVTV